MFARVSEEHGPPERDPAEAIEAEEIAAEAQETAGEEIAAEVTDGAWLDADEPARERPPDGDLPDDFAIPAKSRGAWSRFLGALRGRCGR